MMGAVTLARIVPQLRQHIDEAVEPFLAFGQVFGDRRSARHAGGASQKLTVRTLIEHVSVGDEDDDTPPKVGATRDRDMRGMPDAAVSCNCRGHRLDPEQGTGLLHRIRRGRDAKDREALGDRRPRRPGRS